MHSKLFIYCFVTAIVLHQAAFGQTDTLIKPKAKASSKEILKDTLDGKLDFSSFLIDAKGFIRFRILLPSLQLADLVWQLCQYFLPLKKDHRAILVISNLILQQALQCTQSIKAGCWEACASAAFRQKD